MELPPSLDPACVPPPDDRAEPAGFVVETDGAVRIHFLDWGGPTQAAEAVAPPRSPLLLVHGLAQTAWAWAPVARRVRARTRTVAMDLRGHGLSDAPTGGYEPVQLVADAVAVAEGAGLLSAMTVAGPAPASRIPARAGELGVVVAGHGFGACIAAWTAAALGSRCAGLVLVDGGLDDLRGSTGMEPDEFVAAIAEPPEVLASMAAFLADRRGFDPGTWDVDQERAARTTVVEVPAGHLLPAIRPHALAATVVTMFAYRPAEVLPAVTAPVVVLLAGPGDDEGRRERSLVALQAALAAAARPPITVARFPDTAHNLMRYRPVEVAAALLGLVLGQA